jgi:hypothetical protein
LKPGIVAICAYPMWHIRVDPPLGQMFAVHGLRFYLFKIHFDVSLLPMHRLSRYSRLVRFFNLGSFLISLMPSLCPIHLILLDLIFLIFDDAYKLWGFSLCSSFYSTVISSLLIQYVLLSRFSKTFICVLFLGWFHTHKQVD